MQSLAVDRQILRGRRNDRLHYVFHCSPILGLCLAQLVDDHNLCLEGIAPRGRKFLTLHDRDIRTTDRPQERRIQRVLARTRQTAMQDGVIDFAVSVLELVRQHIKDMLALEAFGDQALDVRQPAGRIAHRRRGPGIAPSVAVHITIHCR